MYEAGNLARGFHKIIHIMLRVLTKNTEDKANDHRKNTVQILEMMQNKRSIWNSDIM